DHVALPSCPTRRSSDLRQAEVERVLPAMQADGVAVVGDGAGVVAGFLAAEGEHELGERIAAPHLLQPGDEIGCQLRLAAALVQVDRKSTRLNSSHVKIS